MPPVETGLCPLGQSQAIVAALAIDPLLDKAAAAVFLGCGDLTLRGLAALPGFPAMESVDFSCGYRLSDLLNWASARKEVNND